jgi:BirA family transcriptional regulator, biotin operon repressor / biotin---[acetyl-CoA-carboxylase] ligase
MTVPGNMASSFFNTDIFRETLGVGNQWSDSDLILFDRIDSTSSWLLQHLGKDASPGAVVIARTQSGGRGRTGNSWHSDHTENLYISHAVQISGDIENRLPLVPLAAGIAAHEALVSANVMDVQLKWPNDLMVESKKVGGILCETPGVENNAAVAVVGMGVNIGRQSFPDELTQIARYILPEEGESGFREKLAARWVFALGRWVAHIHAGEVSRLIARWKEAGEPFGRRVRVGDVVGNTVDLNGEGRLLIRQEDGEIRVIPGGMVTYVE